MSNRFLDEILSERLELLVPENKDNTEETLRKIERFRRNIQIYKTHLGLDGLGGLSMEKTGAKYGLTRESVRQITDKLTSMLKMNKATINELIEAAKVINSIMPACASRVESELHAKNIIKNDFMLEGVLNAADIYGVKIKEHKLVVSNSSRFVVQKKMEDVPKTVMSVATKQISHNGAVNVPLLAKELSGISQEAKESFVQDLANSIDSVVWLNEKWFHFGNKGLNRVANRIDKLFSVYSSVHVETIYKVIKRNWRKGAKENMTSILPKEIMRQFVLLHPDVTVIDEVASTSRVYQEKEISPMEKQIFNLISGKDNLEIREKELEDIIVDGDLTKKYAFTQALNFSVLFDRKEWGLYTLAGFEA